MLKLVLSLRFLALFTSFGAVVGALLMFWVGSVKLVGAVGEAMAGGDDTDHIAAIFD